MARDDRRNSSHQEQDEDEKQSKPRRPYPASSFEDALELGLAIHKHAGNKIRRLTLMEKMGRSPSSSASRQMIVNSFRYGITKGNYNSEWIELTPEGMVAIDEAKSDRERSRARFTLAVEKVSAFKTLYDEYVRKRLPAFEVMRDYLQEAIPDLGDFQECIDIFIVNAKFLGLLRTIGGSETLIPIEQALDELPKEAVIRDPVEEGRSTQGTNAQPRQRETETVGKTDNWGRVCFYITPIGDEDSEQRKHADLFMASIVEPAISELGMQVVRADKIGQSGMITSQVIEHVKHSRLVVVDLSFLNPNVFYEMALRHACKGPIVHIIRRADRVPFDVNQSRCIVIDNTDIYSLVPKIQVYKAEIATQARKALEDPEHGTNPISIYYPNFWQ